MDAKHQFKYTYNETDLEEYSPLEVTFEVPGDATLTQMLYNFERYLQAAGFVFDGHLEFVKEDFDDIIWPSDSIGWENEPEGGCMADFDKECGCKDAPSPLDEFNNNWEKLSDEQRQKCLKEALKMSGL